MPIYEYRCEECGHQLDALQKIADAPLTDCPECHQSTLRKLVSAVGFRLKGGGWYETDFKDSNKKNLAGDSSDSKPAATNGEGSDKKADSGSKSKDNTSSTDTSGKKKVESSASNAA